MQPPRVAVDAADVQPPVLPGIVLRQRGKDLLPQLAHGNVHIVRKILLVRHEPAPLVIQADAPKEVDGVLRKALKHRKDLFAFVFVSLSAFPRRVK